MKLVIETLITRTGLHGYSELVIGSGCTGNIKSKTGEIELKFDGTVARKLYEFFDVNGHTSLSPKLGGAN